MKRAVLGLIAHRRPIAAKSGRSTDVLLEAGVLSPESAAFLLERKARLVTSVPKEVIKCVPVLVVDLENQASHWCI